MLPATLIMMVMPCSTHWESTSAAVGENRRFEAVWEWHAWAARPAAGHMLRSMAISCVCLQALVVIEQARTCYFFLYWRVGMLAVIYHPAGHSVRFMCPRAAHAAGNSCTAHA
jgi:hypothetical protein